MTPIIIGAGRGRRLAHLTQDVPKPLVEIVGRPMLEHVLMALEAGGFARRDVVYVRGYLGEVIEARYPELVYVDNRDWERNNILASLLCARRFMSKGFVSSYADIVYAPSAIEKLMASSHGFAIVCDRDWRRRYRDRSEHPETDAEKVRVEGDRVVEISRHIDPEQASGEFIGVMKLDAASAQHFLASYDEVLTSRSLEKAYLIDLLQHMIEQGEGIHWVPIDGGYMEIDTTEDARHAESWWKG